MVKTTIVSIIDFCTKYAYATIAVAVLIGRIAGYYAAASLRHQHGCQHADLGIICRGARVNLTSRNLFPDRHKYILAVVDAPTPELAALASSALADKLAERQEPVPLGDAARRHRRSSPRTGCCSCPTEEVGGMMQQLAEAAPLVRVPVVDPSLRGLNQMIALVLAGVREHELTLDRRGAALHHGVGDASEDVLAGRPATFSWRELVNGIAVEPERSAPLHRNQADARLHRPGARSGGNATPSAARSPTSTWPSRLPGAGAAHRPGADRERGIRAPSRRAPWSTASSRLRWCC